MKELYVTLHTKQDKSPVTIENSILRECRKYASVISIQKGQHTGVADRPRQLAALHLRDGDTLTVHVEGADEDAASIALRIFFQHRI